MPYIKKEARLKYDPIDKIQSIETKGDLEYCISRLMNIYMKTRIKRYTNLHDCTYAAMHCADEFRRRFLDKRENDACLLNGDVFDFEVK